jgi:hypothetical protein
MYNAVLVYFIINLVNDDKSTCTQEIYKIFVHISYSFDIHLLKTFLNNSKQ